MKNINLEQYQGLDSVSVLSQLLLDIGGKNPNLVFMCADILKLGPLFMEKYPDRFFNFGIAEANMISAAGGLAAMNKIPVAEIMGCLIPRVAEQIRDDICYNNLNVKIFTSTCALNMAPGGVTHQGNEDISILRSFPNITIVQPASPQETLVAAYEVILNYVGPVYFRVSTGINKEIYDNDKCDFKIGKSIILNKGEDVTLIASGLPVQLALKAKKVLQKEGISPRIINMHTIKPIDKEAILKAAKETAGIVTIEDATISGGLGAAVSSIVSHDYPTKVRHIGIPFDQFTVIGPSEEILWDYFGLNIDNIVKAVKNILS